MRIAICDDEKCYVDAIYSCIKNWQTCHNVDAVSITAYSSSEDLLEFVEQALPFDVAFLDIQFPGELDGLKLAHILKQQNEQIIIIFITNYDEYAIEGYKVNALRFLQKPIRDIHVFECLDIAYKQWSLFHESSIILESNHSIYRLSTRSILFIESRAHYLYVYSTTQKDGIILRQRLPEFLIKLPSSVFIRCHRSYVVNLFHIYSISKSSIILSDGTDVPISDKYWKDIHSKFKAFYRGD